MGEVWRAVDTRRGRIIALKLLLGENADDSEFRVRFERESRLAARLRDEHIIPIHDFGEIDGRLFNPVTFMVNARAGQAAGV